MIFKSLKNGGKPVVLIFFHFTQGTHDQRLNFRAPDKRFFLIIEVKILFIFFIFTMKEKKIRATLVEKFLANYTLEMAVV